MASTGNAGSSLAGLAAAMGIPAAIFVPASAPRVKLVQALTCGAQVFSVQDSYDDAFELCLEACQELRWYNRKDGESVSRKTSDTMLRRVTGRCRGECRALTAPSRAALGVGVVGVESTTRSSSATA